jgi:enoyl-CoA hydratase
MTSRYEDLGPELLVERRGTIRILTLNDPQHLNAFSQRLHEVTRRVWDRLVDDDEAAVVVLTGAGRAFSSGGDLEDFQRAHDDPSLRRRLIREAERLAHAFVACELPIVAAVNGPAVGLGATLAVMSDVVVMADDAYMADPHVSVGLVAGDGGPVSWPASIGLLRAKSYILLGERIPAEECKQVGLATCVVPGDQVLTTALEYADRLAAQPQYALRDTKRALNLHLQQAMNMVLPFSLAAESESFASDEVPKIVERFRARHARD